MHYYGVSTDGGPCLSPSLGSCFGSDAARCRLLREDHQGYRRQDTVLAGKVPLVDREARKAP